jgi:hypothetical protein
MVGGDAKPRSETGAEVLMMGLLFGWLSLGGWAAYANILFGIGVVKLLRNGPRKSTVAPLLALALAATGVLVFKGHARDEGGGYSPLVAWGWGAVLWVLSLVVLTAAAAVRGMNLRLRGVTCIVGPGLALALLVGAIGTSQRHSANTEDRQAFGTAALLNVPVCDVEPSSLEGLAQYKGQAVETQGKWVPQFESVFRDDYRISINKFGATSRTQPETPALLFESADGPYPSKQKLVDRTTGAVIWAQNYKQIPYGKNGTRTCPSISWTAVPDALRATSHAVQVLPAESERHRD